MNIIEVIINYTVNNYSEEEWCIYDSLKSVREYSRFECIEGESISKLVNLLPMVKDSLTKRILIEIIVNYLYCKYDEGEEVLLFDDNEKLLDKYIDALAEDEISINIQDAQDCLKCFIALGIEKNKIIHQLLKKLDKKIAIKILIFLIDYDDEKILQEFSEICEDVKTAHRIYDRLNILSTFILIVHPLCSKYESIYCVSTQYSDLINAIDDWGWNTPGGANYLIEEKVFTEKEGRILEHLGELLCKNVDINSKEIRNLYYEFFENKDPYDVMFTLP
ncbi:hypothetical protein BJV85_000197 [Clostridium acetobutylicum]|uniref:Uncharacterized protein n=1 Tax=Clostridium acetobutylicum (strain ATCC 824 / DSM 792 / JCM 1419 / IAM 19013 / LMG 5710 / NBRC 13948 / NRRL B-527 / VKM B-1787 / 2291 / W) TaxID=272562 RepID=Q97CY7_CLOAB|nr:MULTISPECIES: hypothetical protein [Clostridium]AAK81623.1 Hypothetical protein CA_C3703 [Clostridium acetobutylicum ATCC 824]ADZ22747.1 Conserved hypothetical protein [Clostridium acetobutylicum EA 2018]AEI33002.1 hypothetical protein SMB_G3746 [Clostridium acetobutylicum DSM 1731]AWV80702.1 hypothetical protein DK921_11445 [Clostridium acetobutylicum]MBC2393974.1 hypothetical protein [Clostridium acetobutylicum]